MGKQYIKLCRFAEFFHNLLFITESVSYYRPNDRVQQQDACTGHTNGNCLVVLLILVIFERWGPPVQYL